MKGFATLLLLFGVVAAFKVDVKTDSYAAAGAQEASEALPAAEFARVKSLIACISILAGVYFITCALLAGFRIAEQLSEGDEQPTVLRRTLEAAEPTLNFAPMLCVLFLACQMQEVRSYGGHEEIPHSVSTCIQFATLALLLQVSTAVLAPVMTGVASTSDEASLIVDVKDRSVQVLSCTSLLVLYAASTGVCLGTVADAGHYSSAATCALLLTILFFTVHCCFAIAGLFVAAAKRSQSVIFQVLKLSTETVHFAPMLAMVFVAARMRAMQVDPWEMNGGEPQHWAQVCFFMCTAALIVQTLLVVIIPLLAGGDVRRASVTQGDVEIVIVSCESDAANAFFALLRFAPCAAYTVGVGLVILSVLVISNPAGESPPMPASVCCVICLAVLFFAAKLGLWAAVAVRDLTLSASNPTSRTLKHVIKTLKSAAATVYFCPMLAVLYVCLRLRAQQISGKGAGPQLWAQAAMYASSFAVVFQFLVCLTVGYVTGRAMEVDEKGSFSTVQVKDGKHPWLRSFAQGAQAFSLTTLYGGATTVCMALFLVRPETVSHGH
mmetsp:Transcript_85096/g.150492  ORF Transcript_85096/g.150492 Transcript_85096/m.150492 type:complete len:551 (-) Transcript_85096:35-1687(-)|eukprot:CAMPEP_0197661544 /NCGR_PEP_ID=MMETSP1338-20131121/51515_1 /TAXON_ID=43686 ORGANISM="Pelagodinium beii, Strain RCC1491" /NCGR_SAMPLE_ID=MMETSP1338 /ASSEMBLY_ACC=CAM_ASM_000754 /LENGTH=550 /DNA_ID=CAMNT_0043239113 /DNA_START=92 /DNA_END=1744 /DNA_ORIENTATION=-